MILRTSSSEHLRFAGFCVWDCSYGVGSRFCSCRALLLLLLDPDINENVGDGKNRTLLFRAVLVLPLYTGTGGILGAAMAKRVILKQKASVFFAWVKAVTIHGTWDTLAFVHPLLIHLKRLPEWVEYLTLIANVLILVPVIAIVRASLIQLGKEDGYCPLLGDTNV